MGIDQDAPIKERTKDMIIAICDDCIDHAEDIKEKVLGYNAEIIIELYDDVEKLFSKVIEDKKKYDVIFMNIESLEKVIDSMHDNKEQPKEELVLSFNNTVFRIKMNEIVYVNSEAHKTVIYMLDGIQSFYVSFKSICSQMPDYFYCINKGILVNMNYVKRIENSEVVMTYLENEVRHPLARDKRKDFRERFFEYME